jgi:hypothetical protein
MSCTSGTLKYLLRRIIKTFHQYFGGHIIILSKSRETLLYIFEMQDNKKLVERGRNRKCNKVQLYKRKKKTHFIGIK